MALSTDKKTGTDDQLRGIVLLPLLVGSFYPQDSRRIIFVELNKPVLQAQKVTLVLTRENTCRKKNNRSAIRLQKAAMY